LIIAHYTHDITGPTAVHKSCLTRCAASLVRQPDSDTIRAFMRRPWRGTEIPSVENRAPALKPDGTALWVVCEKSDELWVFNPGNGALLAKRISVTALRRWRAFGPKWRGRIHRREGCASAMKLNPLDAWCRNVLFNLRTLQVLGFNRAAARVFVYSFHFARLHKEKFGGQIQHGCR
jgi:hypothetical protein